MYVPAAFLVPHLSRLLIQAFYPKARLFYEEQTLKMVTTRPIKAGEQIVMSQFLPQHIYYLTLTQWNTYGDLPNAELLRRYGHVDILPLSDGKLGNPGDVVEIRADTVVSIIIQRHSALSSESSQERIDWWLEEGGDE
jgi:SET domain-containing protein 6